MIEEIILKHLLNGGIDEADLFIFGLRNRNIEMVIGDES